MSVDREREVSMLARLLAHARKTREEANACAVALLRQFGSLDRVLHGALEALMAVDGVDEYTAVLLGVVGRLAFCTLEEENTPLCSAEDYAAYLRPCFAFQHREQAFLLLLDGQLRPLQRVAFQEGEIDAVSVTWEPVLHAVRTSGAAYCVLAHSHLSGSAMPSQQDVEATAQIGTVLAAAGAPLLDHLVFSDGAYQSMEELGIPFQQ